MRAKHFITELFQPGQTINFKWSRPFPDEVNVLGKTPQGHELSINFWEITDDIVAIDFTIDADVEQDPDPDTPPKSGHELTRHGEEFAVFTQVVNAITQYLNKLPKNNVFFQVKRTEAQREPLYLKIANRVAKQLGFRQGTAQELEATNPGLYNKFDNRYSKLLWYTKQQQVAEAFDQPYDMSWEKGEAGEDYDALVRLPDGSNLSIMFNEEGPGKYMVEFWRGTEQSVTGEGDAQRIFATVLAAIAKFIQQHQPQSIVFSAHKEDDPEQKSDSRSKLYNRLVQRYAGTMGYNYRSWDTGDSVQYELTRLKPGVTEDGTNNTPTIGINVRSDGDVDYASLIVDGKKKYESRKTDSLGPYVGKTVGIVRTGTGPAVAIGQVTVGEPIVVDAEKFNKLRKQHLVPQGSKFDIDVDGTKYLYPMINPVRWPNERLIKHRGIVSRKIQEQGVAEDAVEDLEKDLKEPHSYDAIDHMMKTIAREEGITAKELHDRFVDKHSMTPDDWIKNKLAENFKDGKNPGRKGLSKRMGVNTKASVSALRKVAKSSSGEKQRMAHWLANMKSGRKKS